VDSVDKNQNDLHVGWIPSQFPGCAVCCRYRDQICLWKESEKLFTNYPQQEAIFGSLHILDKLQSHSYIWGYMSREISLLNGTSPQGEALIPR
jgi:hypothetical protein